MEPGSQMVEVFIVTYRRHEMLRRAIASVLRQTHTSVLVRILNDDPNDREVDSIVESFEDERLSVALPTLKRGATGNFNFAFAQAKAGYVSILEDDNWWEPTFLEEMFASLNGHPDIDVIVGNELIWKEMADGRWEDTAKTIWPFRNLRKYVFSLEAICGSAMICNSSMLIRVNSSKPMQTPNDIPVDVTEHFRERLFQHTILQLGKPLVNYAETINTARSVKGNIWGIYQILLIASVFIALKMSDDRLNLADSLWETCPLATSPRAVTLAATGIACREARSLFFKAPLKTKFRVALWIARSPRRLLDIVAGLTKYDQHLHFLVDAPLTQFLANKQICAAQGVMAKSTRALEIPR